MTTRVCTSIIYYATAALLRRPCNVFASEQNRIFTAPMADTITPIDWATFIFDHLTSEWS